MLQTSMDVLTRFPVRKTKIQKQAFRTSASEYLARFGYVAREEKGSMGAVNLVIGDPEKAKYLVTAHYDTPAGLPFPNLLTPCNFWAFLGYQLLVSLGMIVCAILLGSAAWLLMCAVISLFGCPMLEVMENTTSASGLYAALALWAMLFLMLMGPANRNNANDNTSGVVTVLEIARTLPENLRDKVCFVLFDLEEAGMIGSASYRKAHKKASDTQLVLNLDCVGDGDHLRLFPSKKLKKDPQKLTSLYKACGYFGPKSVVLVEKGFAVYPSDQKQFPYGVGIAAFRSGKAGLYVSRIHTQKDTILEETNVNILRAALTTFLSSDAAQ